MGAAVFAVPSGVACRFVLTVNSFADVTERLGLAMKLREWDLQRASIAAGRKTQ